MLAAFSTTWLLVMMNPFAFTMKPEPPARTGRRCCGPSPKKRLKNSSIERSSGCPLNCGGTSGPLSCGGIADSALSLELMFTTAGFASLLRRTQSGAWIWTACAEACSVQIGASTPLVKPKWGSNPTMAADGNQGNDGRRPAPIAFQDPQRVRLPLHSSPALLAREGHVS